METGKKTPGATPPGESHAEIDARNATGPDADGNFSLTFPNALPKDAVGTYAVGLEGYRVRQNRRAESGQGRSQLYDGQYRR